MGKIILFGFVVLLLVVLTILGKRVLKNESTKKRDEPINNPPSVKEMIEELESKIAYYKKIAEEGNMLAKSKLAFYEQELTEIKNFENKLKYEKS